MIKPITTPGKTYAVTSPNGCTVTTEDGLTLAEIEAGKQGYFVAVSGKVLLSDEAAVLTQLFKLAPQQRLTLLGVLGGGNGLPAGYTRVEYLESTGTQGTFVPTPINKLSMLGRFSLTSWENRLYKVFGVWYDDYSIYQMVRRTETNLEMQVGSGVAKNLPQTGELIVKADYFERKAFLNGSVIFDGFTMPATNDTVRFGILCDGGTKDGYNGVPSPWLAHFAYARLYHLKLRDEKVLTYDLVPALDPTGAPCVFDLVSRKAFYNVGTGDFLYPSESTTYALRRVLPDWGKLTEHGLRRLYHAPADWQGELYDYALEHGYKPIIEPEKPEEGYWTPQWTETEDEIVLEWVETEPPMDESLTNE